MHIAIVDYGMGNLRSVSQALQHVASECKITIASDPAEILRSDRVVLPGQGDARLHEATPFFWPHGCGHAIGAREAPFWNLCR